MKTYLKKIFLIINLHC